MNDDDRDPAGLKAFEDLDFLSRDELRPVRFSRIHALNRAASGVAR